MQIQTLPQGVGEAERTPASIYADEVRNLPSSQRPNTVAAIETKDETLIYGQNSEGIDLDGGTISVSYVRGPNSTNGVHGTAKAPCNVCQGILDDYAIDILQELGGIEINAGSSNGYKGAMFDFNPYNAASREYDRINRFQIAAGEKLFPIGSMNQAIAYVGNKKNIYYGDWKTFFWNGKNLEDYLNRLFKTNLEQLFLNMMMSRKREIQVK
jgi:hypothetical protein